jgi:DNA-binding NarL/FixJ family response regulator
MMSTISAPSILVADDHAMMRDGIVLMIQTAWPDSTCKVAQDYLGVIEKLDSGAFDAIILDLRMPGMRGVESVAQITSRTGNVPVIVCTALEDPSLVQRLLTSGVYCAVNKTKGADELLAQLKTALQQPRLNSLGSSVHASPQQSHQTLGLAAQGSAQLTPRQREILKMLHTGKPSKVIATQLGIGLGTIKSHLHTLYSVLEVNSRSEAIVKSQNWLL